MNISNFVTTLQLINAIQVRATILFGFDSFKVGEGDHALNVGGDCGAVRVGMVVRNLHDCCAG